jgi:hypothetical protein
MPTFEISIATTVVALDQTRRGEASFTVQNETGRQVRAAARPTGLPPTDGGWLTVAGEGEREYDVAGLEQITVAIEIPLTAPAGDYPFRLDVFSVDRPDTEFALGPTVTCKVPEPPPPPPPVDPPGYVETLVGAEAGGLGAMLVGTAVGIALIFLSLIASGLMQPGSGAGGFLAQLFISALEAFVQLFALILLAILLALIGLWAGAAVGAFLVLRARGFKEPRRTALAVAAVFPFWAFLVLVVLARSLGAINDPPDAVIVIVGLVGAAIALVVPALVGRAYARWRQEGHL